MANYILCQSKRTENPYYIDNISTNIFSIEELCYYFYNNICLLDETIINEGLCQWIVEELGMRSLGMKLSQMLKSRLDLERFILPIFKEIQYLSSQEYKELGLSLEQLSEQPQMIREKRKGDYLIRYGKYINGIKVYEKVLEEAEKSDQEDQLIGSVYHNMGCAYARLFQMEEALKCLEHAYERMHTKKVLKSYLFAVYMAKSQEAYEKEVIALGVDAHTRAEMEEELKKGTGALPPSGLRQDFIKSREAKEQGEPSAYYRTIDALLERMTHDYHKNTGF